MASAIPCPPPMHMVISARLPPMRSSSYIALTVMIAPSRPPDGPARWRRHWGSPFGVEAEALVDGQAPARRRPRSTRSRRNPRSPGRSFPAASAPREPGRCPSPRAAHRHGRSPERARAVSALPSRPRRTGQHDGRRAVIDPAGVAGRHRAVLLEHRLQPASASGVVALGCSSVSKSTMSRFTFTGTGTIWSLKRPSAMARAARFWLSSAKAS
jgi:hypothetical protein